MFYLMEKIVYYLTPSSFCFGVKRSIEKLDEIVSKHPNKKIFCIHALVHNPKVTKDFEKRGVTFVERIEDIEDKDSIIIFSAHGTNREIIDKANQKYTAVHNLECPFVSKIYTEIQTFIQSWISIFFYIGKENHQEGKNVLEYITSQWWIYYIIHNISELPKIDQNTKCAVLSQTTLNFDYVQTIVKYIKEKYPNALLPKISDVCKATYERQTVIIQNLDKFETFIVIGGKESNNTKELYNIWVQNDKKSFYGESLEDILKYPKSELLSANAVAITGWASTPIEDIKEVFEYYKNNWYSPKIVTLRDK